MSSSYINTLAVVNLWCFKFHPDQSDLQWIFFVAVLSFLPFRQLFSGSGLWHNFLLFHVQIQPWNAFTLSHISTCSTSASTFSTSFILFFPSHTLYSFLREGRGVLPEKGPGFNPWLLHTLTSARYNNSKDSKGAVMAEHSSHFLKDTLTFRSNSSSV